MEKKSYNNIHTIIKNKKNLKQNKKANIVREKNTKKKEKNSYLNVVASEAKKRKKIINYIN
jgi:hypothetical protein